MDLRIGEKKKIMQFHEQKLETGEANKQSTKCRSKKKKKIHTSHISYFNECA